MGGAPDAPTPIDPNTIIQAQEQANRVNRITPFGSQIYGPNGLETKLDPKMQALLDKQQSLAGKDLTPLSTPSGFGQMQNALMNKMQTGQDSGKGAIQHLPQLQQMTNGFAGGPNNPFAGNNPLMTQAMNQLKGQY